VLGHGKDRDGGARKTVISLQDDTASLKDLARRHDVFLIDQFGVLHDGRSAYPGAIQALSALKRTGATIVLLSNSGKRTGPNEDRLLGLGFIAGSWDYFLTSGEVAWRMFSGATGDTALPPRVRVLLLARDNDLTAVDGLDVELTPRGEDADLVLIAGSEGEHVTLDCYRARMAPAARRGIPAFCTNPDKIMLTRSGQRFGAGRIAEIYEELGGGVTWIGKPFREIYDEALLDAGLPPLARVVAIGDSVEHDIAGANGAGIAAALVRTGIAAGISDEALNQLIARHEARPDYILPGFIWPDE